MLLSSVLTSAAAFSHFIFCVLHLAVAAAAAASTSSIFEPAAGPVHHREPLHEEVCQWDRFEASCPENSVILMVRARYGRFAGSTCVGAKYQDVGCEADVLDFVDRKCSGRPRCQLTVSEIALAGHRPCSADLTSSLDVTYTCIDVWMESTIPCVDGYRTITAKNPGYISNISPVSPSPSLSQQQQQQCTWRITATDQYKHITLTVYDFERSVDNINTNGKNVLNKVAAPSDGLGGRCHQYAVVGDSNSRHETNVCSGDKQRDRHVHKSSGTSADVRMTTRADVTNTNSVYFLLYFEETGCSNPSIPPGASLMRDADTVTVTCASGREKWQLTCDDGQWKGNSVMTNCSSSLLPISTSPNSWLKFHDGAVSASGLTKIIALGCAIGIIFGFLMLGVGLFCIKRCNVLESDKPLSPNCKDAEMTPEVYWTLCQHHQQQQQLCYDEHQQQFESTNQMCEGDNVMRAMPDIYDVKPASTNRSILRPARAKYTPMTSLPASEKLSGVSTFTCGQGQGQSKKLMTSSSTRLLHVYDSPSVPCKCPTNVLLP